MDMDVEELIMPKGFELKGLSVVGWDGWAGLLGWR
jgi:hypothetical protein